MEKLSCPFVWQQILFKLSLFLSSGGFLADLNCEEKKEILLVLDEDFITAIVIIKIMYRCGWNSVCALNKGDDIMKIFSFMFVLLAMALTGGFIAAATTNGLISYLTVAYIAIFIMAWVSFLAFSLFRSHKSNRKLKLEDFYLSAGGIAIFVALPFASGLAAFSSMASSFVAYDTEMFLKNRTELAVTNGCQIAIKYTRGLFIPRQINIFMDQEDNIAYTEEIHSQEKVKNRFMYNLSPAIYVRREYVTGMELHLPDRKSVV